jgi:hypothetical protein
MWLAPLFQQGLEVSDFVSQSLFTLKRPRFALKRSLQLFLDRPLFTNESVLQNK